MLEATILDTRQSLMPFLEARRLYFFVRGQAVFIDLGGARNIIALLAMGPRADDDWDFRRIVPAALGVHEHSEDMLIEAIKSAIQTKRIAEVPRDYYPTIATITNRHDPSSVRIVRGGEIERELGPGYRIIAIEIQFFPSESLISTVMGNAPPSVTTGIEIVLPWLTKSSGFLSGAKYCGPGTPEPHCLSPESFWRK